MASRLWGGHLMVEGIHILGVPWEIQDLAAKFN